MLLPSSGRVGSQTQFSFQIFMRDELSRSDFVLGLVQRGNIGITQGFVVRGSIVYGERNRIHFRLLAKIVQEALRGW